MSEKMDWRPLDELISEAVRLNRPNTYDCLFCDAAGKEFNGVLILGYEDGPEHETCISISGGDVIFLEELTHPVMAKWPAGDPA